jgi:hypothetical protein
MEISIQEQVPSIKLIKGQKDSYGWEIRLFGKDTKKMVEDLEHLNGKLAERFCQDGSGKGGD